MGYSSFNFIFSRTILPTPAPRRECDSLTPALTVRSGFCPTDWDEAPGGAGHS